MIGSIIGDIVGSRFEFNNTRREDFELFTPECSFTDDTICTVAVADALLRDEDFGQVIHEWCRRYPSPMGGYGGRFAQWVRSDSPQPYNSLGNGSAMRVSPCGYLPTLQTALEKAEESASCSHNHPKGIRGAVVITHANWLLRHGANKADIQKLAEEDYGYQISGLSISELQRTNPFDETCPGTIPPALCCFLGSSSFEDAIRKAISIGGDSDTIGAIVGGLAEAHYGVPEEIQDKALSYLPKEMTTVVREFQHLHKRG